MKAESRQARYARKQRQLLLAAGKCVQCGAPRGPNASRCGRCNVANRARLRASKARSRARLQASRGYADVRDRQ